MRGRGESRGRIVFAEGSLEERLQRLREAGGAGVERSQAVAPPGSEAGGEGEAFSKARRTGAFHRNSATEGRRAIEE